MIYVEAIKDGFRLINSRWQLVAVQAGLMFLNFIGFLVMVGIPLGIAFIIFGLDLTGLSQMHDIIGVLKNPAELFSKYFGLIFIVLFSFLLYITIVTTLGLFVFGGSSGLIGRSILDPSTRFSFRGFAAEAKKLFFPLMWYSLFVALVFIVIAFFLGILGGGIAMIVSLAKSQDSTLALFLGIFFSLILAVFGISLICAALAVTVYGIAVLFFRQEGAVKSFRDAAGFIWKNQTALWLYLILLMGYVLASFSIMLVVYPLNLIPIIGTIISFPFQVVTYLAQGYLSLVIMAVVFRFYYDAEIRPLKEAEAASCEAQDSTLPSDTSTPQAQEQETALPRSEPTDQA